PHRQAPTGPCGEPPGVRGVGRARRGGAWMVSVSTAPAPDDRPALAPTGGPAYVALVAVFAPLLLISNIAATKGVGLGPLPGGFTIVTDGGFLLFPLAYVLGDVLSEIYGFRAARRAVLLGFAVSVLGAASFWAV